MIEIYPVHQPDLGKNNKMTKQTHFAAIPSQVYDYQCQKHFSKTAFNDAETMESHFKFEYHIESLQVIPKNRIYDRALPCQKLKNFQERTRFATTERNIMNYTNSWIIMVYNQYWSQRIRDIFCDTEPAGVDFLVPPG